MVNTEQGIDKTLIKHDYNILNIVVNTELRCFMSKKNIYYNILNIVVNTEPIQSVS